MAAHLLCRTKTYFFVAMSVVYQGFVNLLRILISCCVNEDLGEESSRVGGVGLVCLGFPGLGVRLGYLPLEFFFLIQDRSQFSSENSESIQVSLLAELVSVFLI